MTTTVEKPFEGSRPLAELQTAIQQQEGIFGPLQGLRMQAPNNIMTLLVGPSPEPAQRAFIETYEGHPPHKVNARLICVAECLVGGSPKSVAAYRPTSAEDKPNSDDGDDSEG